VRIVALGDSLTAGRGLPVNASFPARLESALKAKGVAVEIVNAGVSGDTASGGLARLDWSVPEGTDAVIVELGANDMLLGIDPKVTRKALTEIVRRLTGRGLSSYWPGCARRQSRRGLWRRIRCHLFRLCCQVRHPALPVLSRWFAAETNSQPDGLHPTAAGVVELSLFCADGGGACWRALRKKR
jgi:acyl-CoA thioesterase-1